MSQSSTNAFKEMRDKSGLSQAEVAARLKFTTNQMISNIERGISSYPIDKAPVLAKMFGTTELRIKEEIFNFKVTKLRRKMGL